MIFILNIADTIAGFQLQIREKEIGEITILDKCGWHGKSELIKKIKSITDHIRSFNDYRIYDSHNDFVVFMPSLKFKTDLKNLFILLSTNKLV